MGHTHSGVRLHSTLNSHHGLNTHNPGTLQHAPSHFTGRSRRRARALSRAGGALCLAGCW
jgi:hypothetical protein